MRTMLIPLGLLLLPACSPQSTPKEQQVDAIAKTAHEAYVTAINSNNVDTLSAMLTEDVVYQAPHEPEIVGKAAVRKWVEGYMGAYQAKWEKKRLDFIVSGDWAIERYSYKSTDTPKAGGPPIQDVGKGLNVYHHDADGTWRVARDSWSSDLPIPAH